MEAETPFKYMPLNPGVPAKRLLTILPDNLKDPVRCTLSNYSWNPDTGQGGMQGKFSFLTFLFI